MSHNPLSNLILNAMQKFKENGINDVDKSDLVLFLDLPQEMIMLAIRRLIADKNVERIASETYRLVESSDMENAPETLFGMPIVHHDETNDNSDSQSPIVLGDLGMYIVPRRIPLTVVPDGDMFRATATNPEDKADLADIIQRMIDEEGLDNS